MKKLFTLLLISLFSVSLVIAQTPNVIMKSTKKSGEAFTIKISATSGSVKVDWGDGILVTHTGISKVWSTLTSITPPLPSSKLLVNNPTIKIYSADMLYLSVPSMKLTSLELINTSKLKRINANANQLTGVIGLSQSTVLATIVIDDNLFDACGIEYIYNSLYNNTSTRGTLKIFNYTLTGNAQNQHVIDSKISIANNSNWDVCDAILLAANPDYYILETTAIGCVATADVIMQSTMMIGENFSMRIEADKTPIYVDFGDGIMRGYAIGTTFSGAPDIVTLNLPVDNPTIKIYGDLLNLRIQSLQLTSLELINTSKLRRLDTYSNQLTAVTGLSQCPMLGNIFLYENSLDACAIEDIYNSLYNYVGPTAKLIINNSTLTGNAQNQHVIDSKISIAENKNWQVCDQGVASSLPEYYISETTGIGCIATGVERDQTAQDVELFPTTVKENLNIRLNKSLLGSNITIYNIVGKTMKTHVIESDHFQLNMENYPNGWYFIHVGDKTRKIIKK